MRISDWSSDVCSSDLLPRTAWNWQQGLAVAVIVGDVARSGQDRRIRSCDVKRRGDARVSIQERVAKFFVELPTDVLAVAPSGLQCLRLSIDRKRDVSGQSVSVCVGYVCCRRLKTK